eukprot:3976685-Pyramimonas_sp.AAC.1
MDQSNTGSARYLLTEKIPRWILLREAGDARREQGMREGSVGLMLLSNYALIQSREDSCGREGKGAHTCHFPSMYSGESKSVGFDADTRLCPRKMSNGGRIEFCSGDEFA